MKTSFSIALFLALGCISLSGQVKIGNNPQTIDAASLLELESNSRALVITRMGNAQMQGLFPLRGALVYNTDEGCVFYYNGTSWVNLCADNNTTNISLELQDSELILTDSDGNTVNVELGSAIDQTFSTDPIVNFTETIVITQTGDNYNFEVGQITGREIADSTIQGVDLAPESVTKDKIGEAQVGTEELAENAVTDDDIDFFSAENGVTLSDFVNDVGFLTISPEMGNAIIDNNGAFYDDTLLQNSVTANAESVADHIAADGDLNDQNEIQNAAEVEVTASGNLNSANVQSALEELQGDVDNLNAGSSNTDEQTLSTDGSPGNVSISNGGPAITINVEDGDSDDENEIQDALEVNINPITGIMGGNVQLALEELQTDVDGLNAGGGNTDEQTLSTNGNPGDISISNGGPAITINVEDGDSSDSNEIQTLSLTDNDLSLSNGGGLVTLPISDEATEVAIDPITGITGNNVQLALEELQTDINALNAGGTADGVISDVDFDGVNLNFTGADGGFDGPVNISSVNTDNQIAEQVPFTGYLTLTEPNTQLAIQQLKDEVDALNLSGGGEVNTVSNEGVGGVGIFLQKNAANLEFKNINSGSNRITITDDIINNEIDIDIDETQLTIAESQITGLNYTVDTDDQNIDNLDFDNATNTLSISLVDDGVPDQTIVIPDQTATEVAIADTAGNFATDNVEAALAELAGTAIVDTDDQNIDNLDFDNATNTLSISLVDDGVPDQTIVIPDQTAAEVAIADTAGNFATDNVEAALAELANSTDTNMAENDLTLNASRTHDLNSNDLYFINGNIAIGAIPATPQSQLDVNGQIQTRSGFAANSGTAGQPSIGFSTQANLGMYRAGVSQLAFSTVGTQTILIDANNNVGIGDIFDGTNINAKLHVDGDIRANGDLFTNGIQVIPDYVFQNYFDGYSKLKENYQFKTLEEIEAFVKKNKHLPGVTSATQAQKEGHWNLSQSNLQNLEKIEELFLHTIEQGKKIKALQAENAHLNEELNALKKGMEEMKALILQKSGKTDE